MRKLYVLLHIFYVGSTVWLGNEYWQHRSEYETNIFNLIICGWIIFSIFEFFVLASEVNKSRTISKANKIHKTNFNKNDCFGSFFQYICLDNDSMAILIKRGSYEKVARIDFVTYLSGTIQRHQNGFNNYILHLKIADYEQPSISIPVGSEKNYNTCTARIDYLWNKLALSSIGDRHE